MFAPLSDFDVEPRLCRVGGDAPSPPERRISLRTSGARGRESRSTIRGADMKQDWKQMAAVALAGACTALVIGCESMNDGTVAISAEAGAPPVSRVRVIAELREAQRLGLITVGE